MDYLDVLSLASNGMVDDVSYIRVPVETLDLTIETQAIEIEIKQVADLSIKVE